MTDSLDQSEDTSKAPPSYKALQVGDTVPDITIHNVLNYPLSSFSLADLKGKFVIIDFWGSWCGGCIRQFPRLDSIQRGFKDKLIVLAVTDEARAKIEAVRAKRKIIHDVSFPIITNDTVLDKLFPHYYASHGIILSPEGAVQAITSTEYLTKENIQKYLKGEKLQLPAKTDVTESRPLFTEMSLPEDKLFHYSILLKGRILGLPGGSKMKVSSHWMSWMQTNAPLLEIYRSMASFLIKGLNDKRILLEVRDSSQLVYDQTDLANPDWLDQNYYSYNLVAPILDTTAFFRYALDDLSKSSPYSVRISKQKVNCWVLIDKNKPDGKITRDGTTITELLPASLFVDRLDYDRNIKGPAINESNYTGKMDFLFPLTLKDPTTLNKELSSYGLRLIREDRIIDMLVVTDKN